MELGLGFHGLWPTPISLCRLSGIDGFNAALVETFVAMRQAGAGPDGAGQGAFYASDDDLLQSVRVPGWDRFVRFVVDRIHDTAAQANEQVWPTGGMKLQVSIQGMWFQISNQGAFHDVHTHGNCSWSGVYVVQVDAPDQRVAHPVYGAANGVTRFYGPPFATLGGAFVDIGNAYLQPPHRDVEPVPGQLTIFPSWLAHQALPYGGQQDRVIISFNAAVHATGGDQLHGYAGT